MGFGNLALITSAYAMGQSPDTPRRPSSAGNISDSSGTEIGGGGNGQQPGAVPGNPFRPGQVRVDDTRGTERPGQGGPGGVSGGAFRPGQVRVDDTRGTERRPPATVPTTPTTTYSSSSSSTSSGSGEDYNNPPAGYYWDFSDTCGGLPTLRPIQGYRRTPPPTYDEDWCNG